MSEPSQFQAEFFKAVAPNIFHHYVVSVKDLLSEPEVPGGKAAPQGGQL